MNPDKYSLAMLFEPQTIAVVGASQDPMKGGHRPLRFLSQHGYRERVCPVNPKYGKIDDLECYPSILDIPGPVDAVMITVPEDRVFGVLEECEAKGVKLIIIRTAFDLGGRIAQTEARTFLESVRKSGVRIMGPASLGFVNVHKQLAAYFHVSLSMERLIPGKIGLISQSGGLSGVIFNRVQDLGVGFSHVFSTGIEIDLETADYMEFLIEDPSTQVICCFIEGFRDPIRILGCFEKAAEAGKPVVMMKLGRSHLGMKAARSHTGKMVGRDEVWSALFKQKGIVRADTIDELVETSVLFAKAQKPEGAGLGIFASSGGGASISSDQAGLYGLDLCALSEKTQRKLQPLLPRYASIDNPLDGGPLGEDQYMQCLEFFAQDESIDLVLLPLTIVPKDFGVERARQLVRMAEGVKKPLIVLWLGGSLVGKAVRIVEESPIPIFRSEERCVKALRSFIEYHELQTRSASGADPKATVSNAEREAFGAFVREKALTFGDASSIGLLLDYFDIPRAREGVVASSEEALGLAQQFGYPVALKVLSPQVIHKTEYGGVRTNIQNDTELLESCAEIINAVKEHVPGINISGILVQEMISNGTEFLLGMHRDSELGPIVTCGLGGIFVELLRDFAMGIPPFDAAAAEAMLKRLKGYAVLSGYRGKKGMDIRALARTIAKFSRMSILLEDQIDDIEINPLVVLEQPNGVIAVDCRAIARGP